MAGLSAPPPKRTLIKSEQATPIINQVKNILVDPNLLVFMQHHSFWSCISWFVVIHNWRHGIA